MGTISTIIFKQKTITDHPTELTKDHLVVRRENKGRKGEEAKERTLQNQTKVTKSAERLREVTMDPNNKFAR